MSFPHFCFSKCNLILKIKKPTQINKKQGNSLENRCQKVLRKQKFHFNCTEPERMSVSEDHGLALVNILRPN